MNYRTLGRTGLSVSEIGFGPSSWGSSYQPQWSPKGGQSLRQSLQSCIVLAACGLY